MVMDLCIQKALAAVDAGREALERAGWAVDLVLDFGSHARGEAGPESDYDVNIYVHREGWLYLFDEYAKQLKNQHNEVFKWHNEVVRPSYPGCDELTGSLEAIVREAVGRCHSELPVYVLNVFDTRLVLLNIVHETWSVFELVHGAPIGDRHFHDSVITYLQTARPFHRRFMDVHFYQCDGVMNQAAGWLGELGSADGRCKWLATTVAYLRNLLSLCAFLADGWFVCAQAEIIGVIKRLFPEHLRVAELLWAIKFAPELKKKFIQEGILPASDQLSIKRLHESCISFAGKVRETVCAYVELSASMRIAESDWLPQNAEAARRVFPSHLQPYIWIP